MKKSNSSQPNQNLDENQLRYRIFISPSHFNNPNDSHQQQQQPIEQIFPKIIEQYFILSRNYIWNNEKFSISKPVVCDGGGEGQDDVLYSTQGHFDYGDNLTDEWFVVYVMLKLTSLFPCLVAQLEDSDGEFMLIHAANHLPSWASSAADHCMENRVFIYNGRVHMIPPASNPSQITYFPAAGRIDNASQAARIIFRFANLTQASQKLQACIQDRLKVFECDEHLNAIYHRATCIIPAKLAWLLNNNPALISLAVNRFCDKDPNDLKLCTTFSYFQPCDLVNYRVKFTKHLYGKLKYCDYKPDKRHQWPTAESLIAEFGAESLLTEQSDRYDESSYATLSKVQERSLLGFKLTCAFEIVSKFIANDATTSNVNSSVDTSISLDAYLDRLKSFGYFKDNLENSLEYNKLMNKAKDEYAKERQQQNKTTTNLNPIPTTQTTASTNTTPFPSASTTTKTTTKDNKFSELLESLYSPTLQNNDYVLKIKEEIQSKQNKESDDNDDWLCVEAPQLDDYLEMYSRAEVSSTYDFRLISDALKRFLRNKPKQNVEAAAAAVDVGGVDYRPIDKDDEQLIDFNVESIESNLKELLEKKKTKSTTKTAAADDDDDDDDEDYEDENDSFYEVDKDLLDDEESSNNGDDDDDDEDGPKSGPKVRDLMDLMDMELNVQKDLSRLTTNDSKDNATSGGGDDDLNLDLNLVTNALESYSSQMGLTGPVSNILKSLGL